MAMEQPPVTSEGSRSARPLVPDLELREIRRGSKPGSRYVRLAPRSERSFEQLEGGYRVTQAGMRPRSPLEAVWRGFKRLVVGAPLPSRLLIHERLTKVRALGVFSSDPLSSAAYSAEEIMLVLVLAGTGALYLTLPITAALLALLWVVRLSYIQTIKAYPNGGGAYIVARENLGVTPGLIAAAALLVDYVLTVAVSVAAGVAAITSAAPGLLDYRVPLALAAVAVITVGNLRGIRESGAIFGLPTYFFIVSFSAMIIVGLVRLAIGAAPGSLLHSAPASHSIAITSGLSLFLILRAFSSGAAAVTGIEAISNGVPAFKSPEPRNAQITMQWEAAFLGFFLLGVAFLGTRYGIVPRPNETVVSILGREILGRNVLYYSYQVATAGVLFLAANTAYADFPRLSAILGRDRFAPHQLAFRGDRLGFSNGIMLLGAAACVLLITFQAEVTRLIPLYILGVFVSMTLSQSGMVRHWLRLREHSWRISLALNGIGAVATAVVVVIVGATKLTQGAWMSLVAMLTLFIVFSLIHRHYQHTEEQLAIDEPPQNGAQPAIVQRPSTVVVPVEEINRAVLQTIDFARSLSTSVTAVHVADEDDAGTHELQRHWDALFPAVPLVVIESPWRSFVMPMLAYFDTVAAINPEADILVVLPALVPNHFWEGLLHNSSAARLKKALARRPRTFVVDVPFRLDSPANGERTTDE
jgi:amino acid transporter